MKTTITDEMMKCPKCGDGILMGKEPRKCNHCGYEYWDNNIEKLEDKNVR